MQTVNFQNLSEDELYAVDGGVAILGILAAGAIVAGTAVVVGASVVVLGKGLQKLADWIG